MFMAKSSKGKAHDHDETSEGHECNCGCGGHEAPGVKVIDKEGEVLHITDDNFEAVRSSNDILVIDFWAEWCGPCQMFGPIMEKFAKKHAGKIAVGKLNVDENNSTASLFGVESIPSIIFFKKGEPMSMIVGAVPLTKLEEVLDDVKNKK
jgi:thioredoxin 1